MRRKRKDDLVSVGEMAAAVSQPRPPAPLSLEKARNALDGVRGQLAALRRRSAIEAVIGHMKAEGHLGRCYLKGRAGDAANVILSAIGYNLRLVLAWLRMILRVVLIYPKAPGR